MQYLKQSTAVTLKIGPFLDDTDGKTAETGLTITQADIRLSKNGGNIAQKTEAASATHDELGIYGCPIDATDTATLGRLQLWVHESGALPVWHEYTVLPANVYDSMFSTDKLEVDLLQIGGVAQSATDLKDFADAGYDPATNKVQGVVLTDAVTTLTGHTVQTGDSYARLGSPAGASIAADLLAIDNFVDELESRLTAVRAGYLDNLSAGAVALASICTDMRLSELDAANIPTDINAILIDTIEIGAAGAGLTNLGGMSIAMKAELETKVNDALVVLELDHLIHVAVGLEKPTLQSYIDLFMNKDTDQSYSRDSDSLQGIRDRGDAAWLTGTDSADRLLMVNTTIATLASQTSFTLTAGSADNDAYNNCTIIIEDALTATRKAIGLISNYVGATRTVTLKYNPEIFIMAVTDKIYILAENALKSTLANRQLNVAADGDIAGNVDGSVASLVGHTAQTGDNYVRIGAPAAASIAADLLAIDNFVDELESRLTAIRAGYLDNLSAGAVALASICTEGRLSELDAANLPADIDSVLADTNELQGDWTNGGRLDLIIDAIKAETDNLPSGLQKNVALSNFSFLMTDSTDNTPKTGLTVTVQLSKDGDAFGNATNTPATEIANGVYKINLTQAEMNADVIIFKATTIDANQTTLVFVTST